MTERGRQLKSLLRTLFFLFPSEELPSGAAVATEGAAPETPVVEAEEESSDEVVNCVCGFREETGTMIQVRVMGIQVRMGIRVRVMVRVR